MATVNERLFDLSVDHAIDYTHLNNDIVRRMIAILNKSDAKLFAELTAALENLPVDSFTVQRLESMLTSVRVINAKAYASVKDGLETELKDVVSYEAEFQHKLFTNVLPVQVSVATVTPELVYTAAMARPFQVSKNGAVPLNEYLVGLSEDRAAKIRDAVRLGYVNGETLDQIVRGIRGTRTLGYADGLMQQPRLHIEGMVRTAVNHMSNFTAQRFYETNSGIIKGVMWVSTLDSRTSLVCASRDREVYPIDSGPRPPAHIGCRSRISPVTKTWREMGIDMDEITPSTRASIDGQIPQEIKYSDWLKSKPAARQDEILGSTKGKLFRAGMPIDKFVDNKGRVLTIPQLRAKDSAMFEKAGIQ